MHLLPKVSGNPDTSIVTLSTVKGGRTFENREVNGQISYYQVVWVNKKDRHRIIKVDDMVLVMNLRTGRLVYKPANLQVKRLWSRVQSKYTDINNREEVNHNV